MEYFLAISLNDQLYLICEGNKTWGNNGKGKGGTENQIWNVKFNRYSMFIREKNVN